jgi:hypothetical protein
MNTPALKLQIDGIHKRFGANEVSALDIDTPSLPMPITPKYKFFGMIFRS